MSKTVIQPYLFFGGRCEEALAFYQTALGAKVGMVLKFNQSPTPMPEGMLPPGFENKVMHSSFYIGDQELMASDGCTAGGQTYAGFSLSISVQTIEESEKTFAALAVGGTVKMPLTKTFWSPSYGMLTDRFGIDWMVSVPGEVK